MNPNLKNRTSGEALDEHMKQLKAAMASRRHSGKIQSQISHSTEVPEPVPPTPPPPPPLNTMASQQRHHMPATAADAMRIRSDSSATSIYVMGNNAPSVTDGYSSNPPTIDRKQDHRLSWVNMRRRADGSVSMGLDNRPPITPSPQTTRSYISNITTTEIISSTDGRSTAGLRDASSVSGAGGASGTISGRTTATSGHISSSGVATICGSNNTLNEMHSDYHSQEVGGSRDFHNFSRNGASPMKQNMSGDGSFNMANGSTVKLISAADDESNQQDRSKSFWEVDCQANSGKFFKENFRMDRETFKLLCSLLPSFGKEDTNYRNAIPLEKRVAIALYALGSSAEYRSLANLFGVGKSTVGQILNEFCALVWSKLKTEYMSYFPLTPEKIEECVNGFQDLGFPQCLGAIDGCHIEIHPHSTDAVDYFNYKGWYSTVLFALVDYRYRFMYINVGSPGRCNDSTIFEDSLLKKTLDQCPLLSHMSKSINGVEVPILLIGDSAFRFSTNVMKPYPYHCDQDRLQKNFNYALSKSRRVVENAFGHLKARFRRIGKGIDNSIDNANGIIKACCVLHNFLNEQNDIINNKWLDEQRSNERNEQPEHVTRLGDENATAEEIRKSIASSLCDRYEDVETNENF